MNRTTEPQTVIITGASGGIGAATAKKFATAGGEFSGCHLVLVDHPSAKAGAENLKQALLALKAQTEKAKSPGELERSVSIQLSDVTNAESVDKAAADTVASYGKIHVLVNSAGIMPRDLMGVVARMSWDALEATRKIMEVNYWGTMYWCRAVLPHMRTAGYGRIVNISSIAALKSEEGNVVYGGSKAAVASLTYTLAKEAPFNRADPPLDITVNVVAPGIVETPMTEGLNPRIVDPYMERNPLRRNIRPEEVAYVIQMLASREASAINGAHIVADGGYLVS